MVLLTLEDLPTDLLATIFEGERSWAILELWKCGSRLLSAKFAQGGACEVVLNLVRTRTKFQWPRCLKQFQSLRLLSVTSQSGPSSPEDVHLELKQLNGGLKTLQLDFPGAQEAIFWWKLKAENTEDDSPRAAQPRPSTTDGTSSKLESIEIWDLNATHGQLERLKIGPSFQPLSALDSSVFEILPQNLAHFEIGGDLASCTSFDGLPRSLTTLALPSHLLSPSNIHNGLPKTVTQLICPRLAADTIETLLLDPNLLPNLTDIPGDPSLLATLIEKDHLHTAPSLHNVQSLKLTEGPWNMISALPLGLIDLDLSAATFLPPLGFEWVASLPRFLRSLKAQALDWSAINADLWPSSLTRLSLMHDDSFNPMHFHRIGRSVLSLSVAVRKREWKRERLSDESGMKSALMALGRDALQDSEKTTWTHIKAQLLKRTERLIQLQGDSTRRYISEVEKGALFGLPLSLTHLSCREHRGLALLCPPRLTKLELTCKGGASTQADFFELMPPSLTDIALDCLANGDLLGLMWAQPSSLPVFHFLSLKLVNSTTAHSIASILPSSLVWLHLEADDCVLKAEDLRALPSRLESLSLACAPTSLADNWLDALPRTLRTLSLRGPRLKGNQFAQLPSNLETLDVAIEGVTLAQLLSAPRSLRTITSIDRMRRTVDEDLTESDLTLLTTSYVPLRRIWESDPIIVEAQVIWNRAKDSTRKTRLWLPPGPLWKR